MEYEDEKNPDIKREELLNIVSNFSFENGTELAYNGTNYYFITIDEISQEEEDKSEAFISFSDLIDGWDIYILNTLPLEVKQRILFHEMLEGNLKDQGFAEEAHNLALTEEEKVFGKRPPNITA